MTIKETKKPIGFAAWAETDSEKDIQTREVDLEEKYEDKFCEYDRMMLQLIDERSQMENRYLKEKRKRLLAEMQIIDLETDIQDLKKKIKKLKKRLNKVEKAE